MRVRSLLIALLSCASAVADAQDVRVLPGRANWSATGTTVTATFIVENATATTLQTVQRIELPPEWRLVAGNMPMTVLPAASGLLIVSAMVPVKTTAGAYVIRVAIRNATDEKPIATDSLTVTVAARRTFDVALVDYPSFIVSGKSYDAEFMVRNRGNVAATIQLKTRSSMGEATLPVETLHLEPGDSRSVGVHVTRASTAGMAVDDVVELFASMRGDGNIQRRASARVTVVPPASTALDEYQRLPTQLALRAASASGVSPFVFSGAGRLRDGGSERVEFMLRGRPGPSSLFGDRDEYRVDFRAPTWRVRAGDHLFSVSPLTGGSQEGMGLGADKRLGVWGLGGYAEQFRRTPGSNGEAGAFVSASPADGVRLALNGVTRQNGVFTGQVGSVSANIAREGLSFEAEMAGSTNGSGSTGIGRLLHASGERGSLTFDLGHSKSDETFLGPQRGSRHDFVSASVAANPDLAFNVSASAHANSEALLFGLRAQDKLRLASAGVTVANLVTVEAAGAQHVRHFGALIDDRQTSLRARVTPEYGRFGAAITAEFGRALPDSGATRGFTDLSMNVGVNGSKATATVFAGHYSGGSVMKGIDPTLSLGGSASLRFGSLLDATVIATANRLGTTVPYWVSNVDAQLTHALRNGATMSLRARVMQGGFGLATATPAVAYLEYSMPIGVPVSKLRTPGRAIGRVLDASGRGVGNTLVRLGPQVGITDKWGRVSFGGLPVGEHRVSLAQETSFADAVFVGDEVLQMDSTHSTPKHFTVTLTRGARVDVAARRYAVSRTGFAGSADSLVDVGPLTGTGFRLVGERDTLYRVADESGRVSFMDIAPGKWLVEVDGDVPSFQRFDPEKMMVDLVAGETRTLSFRLMPRPREVKIMNAGEEVQAMPAETGASPATNGTRAVRPQVLQPQQQR